MEDRALLVNIAVLVAALVVLSLYPYPVWHDVMPDDLFGDEDRYDPDTEQPPGEEEELHEHGYLFFLVEGDRKQLGIDYLMRDPLIHFHQDDGIIHVHEERSNLSRTLDTLEITVNESCLGFGLDNETYCETDIFEVRININGETLPLEKALEHDIQQDDNIVVFYGREDAEIPEEYTERILPDVYRPATTHDHVSYRTAVPALDTL